MSDVLDNVVETSNNIGVVQLNQQQAKALIMVRSMVNREAERFSQEIAAHFNKAGIHLSLHRWFQVGHLTQILLH
jgi:dipeptidase D